MYLRHFLHPRLVLLMLVTLSGLTSAGPLRHSLALADTATTSSCSVDLTHLALTPEEQIVLDLTNAYRASYGLSALRPDFALAQNALWKSTDLGAHAYTTHDDGFRTWQQRFADCGYDTITTYYGENLAGGDPSAAGTLGQWQSSPLHNANLLDPHFTAVGIKRVHATDPADRYGWYWAMELGSALDANLNDWLSGH